MQWNMTSKLGAASLVFGVLFLAGTVALLATPVTDIGMLSVTMVFVLLGFLGILLGRQQMRDAQDGNSGQ